MILIAKIIDQFITPSFLFIIENPIHDFVKFMLD